MRQSVIIIHISPFMCRLDKLHVIFSHTSQTTRRFTNISGELWWSLWLNGIRGVSPVMEVACLNPACIKVFLWSILFQIFNFTMNVQLFCFLLSVCICNILPLPQISTSQYFWFISHFSFSLYPDVYLFSIHVALSLDITKCVILLLCHLLIVEF